MAGRTTEAAILPTWLNQRAVTFWGFNYIWIGLAVVIVTFQYGANGVPTVLAIVWFATAALAILLPRYGQAEIESGFDGRYLATSLGPNWVYHRGEGFTREKTEEIPESAVKREDL